MQLEFRWRDEDSLKSFLESRTGLGVSVVFTDNSATVMSLRGDPSTGTVKLRLHHMFLHADQQVVDALAHWVRNTRSRRAAVVLNRFVRAHRHLLRPTEGRGVRLNAAGRHHDLKAIFDELNRVHFSSSVTADITWGRMPAKRRRRSIRFGCYSAERGLIRIHPLLDSDFVPGYFVRYIVFHEMLHAHVGISESESGRRRIHTPRFNSMERTFPDYAKAFAWQNNPNNLKRLLG